VTTWTHWVYTSPGHGTDRMLRWAALCSPGQTCVFTYMNGVHTCIHPCEQGWNGRAHACTGVHARRPCKPWQQGLQTEETTDYQGIGRRINGEERHLPNNLHLSPPSRTFAYTIPYSPHPSPLTSPSHLMRSTSRAQTRTLWTLCTSESSICALYTQRL
jgi:hypothetical protein